MTPDNLADRVAQAQWYHTIELPGGIVTRGHYDKRPTVTKMPFPASLAGMRCLDVGTSDGFWAFEMEKRGAAEVVAVDIDDPADYDWPDPPPERPSRTANREPGPNPNFVLAHEALGSRVQRVDCRIYDITPERLGGKFDFVFMGSLMLHLRDPVGAIAAVRSVVGGTFLQTDTISLYQSFVSPRIPSAQLDADRRPRWWAPNVAGYRRMIRAGGYKIEQTGGPYFIPFGHLDRPSWKNRRESIPRFLLFHGAMRHLGAPSCWALCTPA